MGHRPATVGHLNSALGMWDSEKKGSQGSPQGQEVLLVRKELGHGVGTAICEFVVEETAGFQERWKQST